MADQNIAEIIRPVLEEDQQPDQHQDVAAEVQAGPAPQIQEQPRQEMTSTKKSKFANTSSGSKEVVSVSDFEKQLSAVKIRKEECWVDVNGDAVQEGGSLLPSVDEVLAANQSPDMMLLRLRDPDHFVAGGVHNNVNEWKNVLSGHPMAERILGWLCNGVDVKEFKQSFRGRFKRTSYDSEFPPTKSFQNHKSCKQFSDFVSKEILKRVAMQAVRPWGRVADGNPPHLVLSLTVEPSKPRLCLDGRFINLWMKDSPFHLDRLADVPRYVYKDSYITKCDDKSAYDHVRLHESSQTYFGFEWGGWWFVCATLPFGWKESPFVYHTIGLAVSGYLRCYGIPCSLYIDDRLNGELLTTSGPWSLPPSQRSESFRLEAARAAIFIALSTLVRLGYTIGIEKSCLSPVQSLLYLGLIVDSKKQAFLLPEKKIESFVSLRESILKCKEVVDIKTLQQLKGMCISLSLVVPCAKLLIRSMSAAIGSAPLSGLVSLSPILREEISHWRFLDQSWSTRIRLWRDEKQVRLSMCTVASGDGWQCILHRPSGDRSDQIFSECWSQEEKASNISTKELMALINALKTVPNCKDIRNCRLDVEVDSQVVVDTIEGRGSKSSPQLTAAITELFFLLLDRNLQIKLSRVPSALNPAHSPSRVDSKLSPRAWHLVEHSFGGNSGHTFDLMALDSNAAQDCDGKPLPHFTPFASPSSLGVNLFAQDVANKMFPMSNPYVFPPFGLVGPVVKFLSSFGIPFTIVVPEYHPQSLWWPGLLNLSTEKVRLGLLGDMDVLLVPYNCGYKTEPCPVDLWACRVSRF